jgi:WD40 repeat protein
LSTSSDDIIKIWDIESNECIKTFDIDTELLLCAKNAPGNIIIRGYLNGSVKIGNTTIDAHTDSVVDILILTQNKFITCSNDCTIKLFDFDTFECIRTFIGHELGINAIDKISTDKIVSCSHESIRIWNINNGECLKVILDDRKYHYNLKVISETELACGSDNDIKILNINSGICLKTFEGHFGCVRNIIHLSRDQIASSDEYGEIRIWNINNGECLRTFNENTGERCFLNKLTRNSIISYLPDENNAKFKIWNTDTGDCLKILQDEIDPIVNIDLF